ncbi:uncharacterized protein [Pyrus communis]|uniref:uncharacterized protein n=1 Tax=Pyrus communis TaxID=23211 RepID=UPI0035BED316
MLMKTESLKNALASLWKLQNSWKLVPLGKGYFDLHFSTEEDMRRVWGGGTCTLQFGLFRLSQWQPDFKPRVVLPQTHAQVWIKIYGLSQEYWHPRILMEIACGVGTPLQLDHATREKLYGYYARILVDVDLSADLPSSIMVEREQHGFSVDIIYENLPSTCGNCGAIGHYTNKCRHLKGNHSDGMQLDIEVHRRRRLPTPQVYCPKPSTKTVSPSGAIHKERSPLVEIIHNERSPGLNNDMEVPPCSSLEQRHVEQVNDFAIQILISVVNTELSVLVDKVTDSSADLHGQLETNSNRQVLELQPTNNIDDTPSCNLNDTLSRETDDEPIKENNIAHIYSNVDGDVPPSFGLRNEFNVVDSGKVSNDFTLVLSLSLLAVNNRGDLMPNIWVSHSTSYCSPTMISSSGQQVTFQASYDGVLLPWMAIGDFNAILGAHEQMGGHLPARTSCEDFRSTTKLCDFTHMDSIGAFYTWTNGWSVRGYMERRVDRSLCDTCWLQSWSHTSCSALPRSTIAYGCPMFVMLEKLKALKHCLRDWNSNTFGDVHKNVTIAKEKLHNIQNIICSDGNSEERFNKEVVAKIAVLDALRMQEAFWRDRVRVKWLTKGDRHIAFFHAYARGRHSSSRIVTLLDGDNVLSSHTAIVDHVVNFYRSLYNSPFVPIGIEDVCGVITPMVKEEEIFSLSCLPSVEEIKSAVFSMDPSSALGPNGFPGSFYQSCWDIVGLDVINFVQVFFKRGWLYPNANCNFVVLIPKVDGAATIAQYQPIALTNFLFKIIPKILVDRLGPIATRIISPHQTTFLKGRRISDCIGLVSEGFNFMGKRAFGGNVGIKVDIAKAFDTLNWKFLLHVLSSFGFSHIFVDWASMLLNKDEYVANLSQQKLDMVMEEMTSNLEVSLQLLMDVVGGQKGKEFGILGVG